MIYTYDDGGRANYFKADNVRDCAVRACAIALGKDYKEVYDEFTAMNKGKSCRNGTPRTLWQKYLKKNGWVKLNGIMGKGTGIQYHLNSMDFYFLEEEYPTMIVQVSKHLTCVKNGYLRDTYNCSRGGNRGVYAVYVPASNS